jgi:hypothetical protein
MMKKLSVLFPLLLAAAAQAHEGHGLPGATHWHASDAWGLALALAIGAGAVWLSARKK